MDNQETIVVPSPNRTVTSGPLVSIGLPTFNRPQELRQALLRLLEQTYSNLEIVVSDNCSTMPEVGEVLAELAARDDRLVCFRQETNIGFMRNHIFVVRKATGELFLWVADDDEIPRDYIDKCVARFGDAPNIMLVGPKCNRYLNEEFMYSYANYSNVGEGTFTRLRGLVPQAYTGPNAFEQYWGGVFRREPLLAALRKLDKMPYRTVFTLFFRISEKGCMHLADDVTLKKNTTPENFKIYKTSAYQHRPWIFRWLGRDMEETIPVTIAMVSTVFASRNLNIREKSFLTLLCAKWFGRTAARIGRRACKQRMKLLRGMLRPNRGLS